MSYQTIKNLLVERLPKLRELTRGCVIEMKSDYYPSFSNTLESKKWSAFVASNKYNKLVLCDMKDAFYDDGVVFNITFVDQEEEYQYYGDFGNDKNGVTFKILGHDPSHSDILKVLGDDWAMKGNYCVMKELEPRTDDFVSKFFLPEDLHDLGLPEWKETCERLISLITK